MGELAQVLAELEMVSHVGAANLSPEPQTGIGNDRGGRRPQGGIDRRDDRYRDTDEHSERNENDRPAVLRSHEHFRRRAARCTSDANLLVVLNEARLTLAAWKVAPVPSEPVWDDVSAWKFWAARSDLPVVELARRAGVSRQAVYQRMRGYEGFRRAA